MKGMVGSFADDFAAPVIVENSIMKRACALVLVVGLSFGQGSAHAQFWNPFRKAAPTLPPEQRVSQLIGVIKSESDEYKRLDAVQDLREFDTKTFPELISLLADVAQRDSSSSVRAEAVSSLVRIRPISPIAGQAIEYVAAKDEHWRNRMNAQAALVRYRLAGYSPSAARTESPTPGSANKLPAQSGEPPLSDRAPIIYYDQAGRVIPAPKGFPVTGSPNVPTANAPVPPSTNKPPVIGTPTSNPPANKSRSFIAPIAPSKLFSPTPTPPARPSPPVTTEPPIEPVFRNVNKLNATPQPPSGLPSIPGIVPVDPPVPTIAPVPSPVPAQGPSLTPPSLELPSQRINTIPGPALAPAPATPPALQTSEASGGQPAGRMDPSPRLTPNSP